MNIELIKSILAYFGATCIVVWLILGIYFLVLHLMEKFEQKVIKGVVEQLRIENCGLPDARKIPEHSVPMTIDEAWEPIDLEAFIESYLKVKGLIK